jgi:hypothetical protein
VSWTGQSCTQRQTRWCSLRIRCPAAAQMFLHVASIAWHAERLCRRCRRSFSTFVAAVIRSLVGFYDISYADGLAVCGAVARESLSYGTEPVYNMMPAVDTSFPGKDKKLQTQNFLVGRLDQNTPNGEQMHRLADVGTCPACFPTAKPLQQLLRHAGQHPCCSAGGNLSCPTPSVAHELASALHYTSLKSTSAGEGILPGATFNVAQFADWFKKRFARGVYDGVALLGSHALLDDQGCVKSAETSGEGLARVWRVPTDVCCIAFVGRC